MRTRRQRIQLIRKAIVQQYHSLSLVICADEPGEEDPRLEAAADALSSAITKVEEHLEGLPSAPLKTVVDVAAAENVVVRLAALTYRADAVEIKHGQRPGEATRIALTGVRPTPDIEVGKTTDLAVVIPEDGIEVTYETTARLLSWEHGGAFELGTFVFEQSGHFRRVTLESPPL